MTSTKTGGVRIDVQKGRLVISDVIRVPIKTAWAMLTNRQHIAEWWGDYVAIELHPGGTFEELWTGPEGHPIRAFGTVREVSAPFTLEVTWREDEWAAHTIVSLHLRDLGNATEVSIVHKDWPTPMTDSVRHEMAKHYHGWKTCLARLKQYAHHYGEAAD